MAAKCAGDAASEPAIFDESQQVGGSQFVAGAIYRSLPGVWKYRRTLTSALPSAPSGEATGTATFSPDTMHGGLRYVEQGTFVVAGLGGRPHEVTQRYLFAHDDEADTIVVHRQGHGLGDTLLHAFGFAGTPVAQVAGPWIAVAELSCGSDRYVSRYGFEFVRQEVATFRVEHRVGGPTKDYISDTTFTR